MTFTFNNRSVLFLLIFQVLGFKVDLVVVGLLITVVNMLVTMDIRINMVCHWIDGWDGWMDGRMCIDGLMDGLMDGVDGWMDGRTNVYRWIDGWKDE